MGVQVALDVKDIELKIDNGHNFIYLAKMDLKR